MASSGWQNEQAWFTYSSNVYLIGNIRIDSIEHNGTNLRIRGAIAAGARGNNNYYFRYSDYTSYAQPEGGNKIALGAKGKTWKVGTADENVGFDVTLSNVAASSTSRSFYVNFYGPNTNSVQSTLRWTLTFDASGSAPTGGFITNISSTWNSITFTSGVTSWGGLNGQNHAIALVGGTNGDADSITAVNPSGSGIGRWEWNHDNTQDLSWTHTGMQSNSSASYDSPIPLKGLTHYKLGYWIANAAGDIQHIEPGLYYMQPSAGKFTYTDPGGEGTKAFPVVFTGDTSNNHTTYDSANLTRTVRYKVNDAANWTYVVQDSQAALDANTSFTVSVPGSQSAVIEGWMTYHGQDGEVKTLTLFNGNAPSRVYAPVNGSSKLMNKLYASVGGQSVEIVKLYGSVNGEAKAILG